MEAASGNLAAPSELNTAAQGHGLEVQRDKLTVTYKAEGRHSTDVGAIQANRPAPLKTLLYYFELTVLDKGEAGRIAIGFTNKGFKLTKQPGWDPGSYGYHGDDGKKFGGNGKGEDYGPKYGKGDTVGACYNMARQEIFFTKNGCKLRSAFKNVRGELFPTVGLHSKGEVIKVNFGQQPFKFDVEALICEERMAEAAAIDRTPVSSHLVHSLVRQYMLHYGYGDTLRAFDAEAGTDVTSEDELPGGQQQQCMEDEPSSMSVDSGPGNGESTCADAQPSASGCDTASASGGDLSLLLQGDWTQDGALSVRQFVRRAIMAGDIQGATDCIRQAYPEILEGDLGHEVVRFHLATQQFIELVRSRAVEAAVTFAQSTLASLRSHLLDGAAAAGALPGSAGPSSACARHVPSEAALRDVVALLAYEEPEASPLSWLLRPEQRERVADAANAALLVAASGGQPGTLRASGLEQLLRQLACVQSSLFELNGSQGECFNLGDHLLPAAPGQPSPMQCN